MTDRTVAYDEGYEPRVMQVRVINRNSFDISDMFDGVPYNFPTDVPVAIPIDAAQHIFGWYPKWTDTEGREHTPNQADMKRHVMKRMGWNTPAYAGGKGDIFYDQLSIQPIEYRMVPVVQQDDEGDLPVPRAAIPTTPAKRNKLMAAADAAAASHAAHG